VAACADAQWSVAKAASRGKVKVEALRLEREARIRELARMLGGAEATARRHAAELLDGG
jgi:DNA repair protein RecN (Recombination protein N)